MLKNELFSCQSKFSFLGGCPNFPFFWQLGPKNAHPQNTIKIGVSANFFFLKKTYASRNGHFWTKKTNPEIPVILFLPIFFSFNNKKQKVAETPIFSVLQT